MTTVNEAIELEANYDRVLKTETAMFTQNALDTIQRAAYGHRTISTGIINYAIANRNLGIVAAETRYRDKMQELEAAVGLPFHKWKRV